MDPAVAAPSFSPALAVRFRSASRFTALATMGIGGYVLSAWAVDLAHPQGGWRGMMPLTAVELLGTALALLLLQHEPGKIRRLIARVVAVFAAAGAAVALAERGFAMPPRLSTAVFDWVALPPLADLDPRMSLFAALGILLLNVALLVLDVGAARNRCPAQGIAIGTLALSIIGLMSSIQGVRPLDQIEYFSMMAAPTAIALTLLSLGVVWARPGREPLGFLVADNVGGEIARSTLPAALVFPLLCGWARLGGERAGWYGREFGVVLVVAANALFFAFLIARIARRLGRPERDPPPS